MDNIQKRNIYYKIQFFVLFTLLLFLIFSGIWVLFNADGDRIPDTISIISIIISVVVTINKVPSAIKNQERYLDLHIKTVYKNNFYSLHTQVTNKTTDSQPIDFAFLLISKQGEVVKVINKINTLYDLNIQYTNDLTKIKHIIQDPLWLPETYGGIIPLPFYYKENIDIADECPTFSFTFDNQIVNLPEGIYEVRFFVFPNDNHRLHRCTADSIVITH